MEIGCCLLRDQNSVGAAEHRSQLGGKVFPVRGRNAQHFTRARCLSRTTTDGGKAGDICVPNWIDGARVPGFHQFLLDGGDVGAGYDFHLPVDGDIAERALGHRRGAGIDENAKDGEQSDRETDAEYRRQHPPVATADETREPRDHRAPLSIPCSIVQRVFIRPATNASCVAMTNAVFVPCSRRSSRSRRWRAVA